MGEAIINKVRQFDHSGELPNNIMFLVAKSYTTGTQETFCTFAQQVYLEVITSACKDDYLAIVTRMNNFI